MNAPLCPQPTNCVLDIVETETWVREFIIKRNDALLGEAGWGITFQLFNPDDDSMAIYTSSVNNGKASWLQAGVIRVVIPTGALSFADLEKATFSLSVTNGMDTSLDPNGTTFVALRGSMDYHRASHFENKGMRTF